MHTLECDFVIRYVLPVLHFFLFLKVRAQSQQCQQLILQAVPFYTSCTLCPCPTLRLLWQMSAADLLCQSQQREQKTLSLGAAKNSRAAGAWLV